MRRFTAVVEKLKPIFPVSGSNGRVVRTIVPKKPVEENNSDSQMIKKIEETIEPMVAFSRPPPYSPFVGPLLMYSLLQSWTSRDEDG